MKLESSFRGDEQNGRASAHRWHAPVTAGLRLAVLLSWDKPSRPLKTVRAALYALLCAATAAAGTQESPALASAEVQHPQGYLGQKVCGTCHREIYESFQKHGMGRSLSRPTPDNVIEDYQRKNTFYQQKSGFYYEMLQRDGRFFQRRYLKNAKGQAVHVHEEEVTYIAGSGNHARTYFHHHPGGLITQLPVTWYPQEQRWAMSPGYDVAAHLDFSRLVPHKCIFCHTAYPRLSQERPEDNTYFPNPLPTGIGCERCHGPGKSHVEMAVSGKSAKQIKRAIYNSSLDSKQAQRDVCYQCHLETRLYHLKTSIKTTIGIVGISLLPGQGTFSHRPGKPIPEYTAALSMRALEARGEAIDVVQHADLMEASKCFQASGGAMTCTSCHDPHRKVLPQDAARTYRRHCRSCHLTNTLSHQDSARLNGDCAGCHMPGQEPENAQHTVFTNHKIGIYPTTHGKPDPGPESSPAQAGRYQLETSLESGEVAEVRKGFALGTVLLLASVDELAGQPEQVRRGVDLLQQYLEKAKEQNDSDAFQAAAYSLLGKGYQALGNVDHAIQAYETSLQKRKGQLLSLSKLGVIYGDRGDLGRSKTFFSAILDDFPNYVPALHRLGTLATLAGEDEEAVAYFQKSLELFPGALFPNLQLAQIYLRRQENDKAVSFLRRSLSLRPGFAPAYLDLGHLYVLQNRFAEARETLARHLKLDPGSEPGYIGLSLVALRQGELDRAIEVLKEAVAKGVASSESYVNLGNLHVQKGNLARAIHLLQQALKINPQNQSALLFQGVAYFRQGEPEKARSLLERLLELDPDSQPARQILNQIRQR